MHQSLRAEARCPETQTHLGLQQMTGGHRAQQNGATLMEDTVITVILHTA